MSEKPPPLSNEELSIAVANLALDQQEVVGVLVSFIYAIADYYHDEAVRSNDLMHSLAELLPTRDDEEEQGEADVIPFPEQGESNE